MINQWNHSNMGAMFDIAKMYFNPHLTFAIVSHWDSETDEKPTIHSSVDLELFDRGWYEFLSMCGTSPNLMDCHMCIHFLDADGNHDYDMVPADEMMKFMTKDFIDHNALTGVIEDARAEINRKITEGQTAYGMAMPDAAMMENIKKSIDWYTNIINNTMKADGEPDVVVAGLIESFYASVINGDTDDEFEAYLNDYNENEEDDD